MPSPFIHPNNHPLLPGSYAYPNYSKRKGSLNTSVASQIHLGVGVIWTQQEKWWKHDQGLSLFPWSNSSELIRHYAGVTKTGAGGLLSLRGLREGGIDGERGRKKGEGIPPPYSIAENNEYIITQRPKHLLSKCSLERGEQEAAYSYNIHQRPKTDMKLQPSNHRRT